MNIFYYIIDFSPELIDIIISYLDSTELKRLDTIKYRITKELYMKSPGVERISEYNYENYIRWIIRGDRSFLLNFSLHNILNNNKTKIYYRNNVFKTYMDYIKYLINTYNSGKCKYLLSTVKST
tara:strand:- start:335 stop:706 length:372 start_codon:yes stop_codon:yes gene_type:complete